jgi:hypothetical protein
MPIMHEPAVRLAIQERLARLRADSKPRWGRMSVDQMLWHVSQALATDLGHVEPASSRRGVPKSLVKFFVLRAPWPKGAPTSPALVATAHHDFETERERCRRLIAELVAQPLDSPSRPHPLFGRMNGREISRLHAKHLDHHLTQFGV